jgi:hypothetical protein
MARAQDVVPWIRKATRPRLAAEEKIRIVLEGPRGGSSISEVCRREGYRVLCLPPVVHLVSGGRQEGPD